MSVFYEWDHETSDEHGDIIDHNFFEKLKGSCFDLVELSFEGNDLVLVRDDDGDKAWAYCRWVDGKLVLPDCWNRFGKDPMYDMPNWSVPKKFHNELAIWQRSMK